MNSNTTSHSIEQQELQSLADAFEQCATQASELTQGLSPEQLLWRPSPGRWSIAECLSHLNETAELYQATLKASLAKAKTKAGHQRIRHGFLGRLFLKSVAPNPETSRPLKAPKKFLPPAELDATQVVERFIELQREWIGRLEEADGHNLNRIKASSPAIKLIRLPIGTWLYVHRDHQQRHLAQAQSVRKADGFPA